MQMELSETGTHPFDALVQCDQSFGLLLGFQHPTVQHRHTYYIQMNESPVYSEVWGQKIVLIARNQKYESKPS